MTSKKDKKTNVSVTKEVTDSLTASSVDMMNPSVEELVGETVSLPSDPRLLIRLAKGMPSKSLMTALKMNQIESVQLVNGAYVPLVLGPYSIEKIRRLAEDSSIGLSDFVIGNHNRWRAIREYFPDLSKRGFDQEENSKTGTQTAYDQTMTHTVDGVNAHDEEPALKLEKIADEVKIDTNANVVPEIPAELKSDTVFHQGRATPPRTKSSQSPGVPTYKRDYQDYTKKLSFGLAFFLLFLGVLYFAATRSNFLSYVESYLAKWTASKEFSGLASSENQTPSKEWPPYMRPSQLEDIYASDSGLVAKIRPILNAVTLGRTQLSEVELRTLKSIADPASANWEARLLAVNQLAAYYLSENRVDDAKKVLIPVLQSATTDTVTLINGALLFLSQKDLSQASDLAASSQRLCTAAYCWLAYSLNAMISASDGKSAESEKAIKDALSRSPGNPLVYGLWLKTLHLLKGPRYLDQLKMVFQESLWTDPDYWWDSPVPAPIAGAFFKAQALAGYVEAYQKVENSLTPGQRSYVKWLMSRLQNDPLSDSINSLTNKLENESSLLSQVMLAYVQKDSQNMEGAAVTLNKAIPILKLERVKFSWPWTLAADIQFSRGLMDQSMLLYTAALSRNSQDRAAVHGLALGLREKSDWSGAAQKFTETISLDSFFIPAKLRVPRFGWQKISRQY